MPEHNKFTAAEMVVGGLFTLAVDGVAALLDTTVVGWLIATPLQAITSAATSLWLKSKGGKRAWGLERQITKQAVNLLPWVPTCTIAFLGEALIHNNPKLAGVTKLAKAK